MSLQEKAEETAAAPLLEVVQEKATPFRRGCYEVEEVYAGSPADRSGIRPGFLIKINGKQPEDPLYLPEREQYGSPQIWLFYDPEGQKIFRLTTDSFPFGMKLRLPLPILTRMIRKEADEALFEAFDRILDKPDAEEFEQIGKAARICAKGGGPLSRGRLLMANILLSFVFPPYLLLWGGYRLFFFIRYRRNPNITPYAMERVLWAAWEAEYRDVQTARKILPSDQHEHIIQNRSSVMGLREWVEGKIRLQLAQELEETGGPSEETGKLRDEAYDYLFFGAWQLVQRDRLVAETLNSMERDTFVPASNIYQPEALRGNYVLPAFDPLEEAADRLPSARSINLKETLGTLADDQFLMVILLGSYRANGPYSEGMRLLQQVAPHIGPHIGTVHLVTSWNEKDTDADREWARFWARQEQQACKQGLPLTVLYDSDYETLELFPTNHSPHMVTLSNRFIKLYEGTMGEKGFWRALEALKNGEGVRQVQGGEHDAKMPATSSLVPQVPRS